MKKVFVAICAILGLSCALFAFPPVWTSSHTTTADTTQILCKGSTYLVGTSTVTVGERAIFHGVCANDVPAFGTVTVYNSSSTATNAFAVLRSSTIANGPCAYFDVQLSSGLVYTTSAANDVTFLYQCY